jgi:rRNA processing protein Gar1
VKAIGTLSHETKSGNLVIQGSDGLQKIPSIYSYATANKTMAGKIQDVIGPKSRPYFILKPERKLSKKELSKLKGATFYESKRSKNAKTRRNKSARNATARALQGTTSVLR